jgi:hypothetical protein
MTCQAPSTPTSAVELRIQYLSANGKAEWSPTYPSNPAAPGAFPQPLTLGVGVTTVTPPTGATSLCLAPPAGSTNAKAIAGSSAAASGGGGIPFTGQVLVIPVTGGTPVYIQSAAVEVLQAGFF